MRFALEKPLTCYHDSRVQIVPFSPIGAWVGWSRRPKVAARSCQKPDWGWGRSRRATCKTARLLRADFWH